MAFESLIGGSADGSGSPSSLGNLDTTTTQLLDTILAGATQATVETLAGGGSLVQGSNANNEVHAALVGNGSALSAVVTQGAVSIQVDLPAGVDLGFRGTDTAVTASGAQDYLHGIIESVLPESSTDTGVVAYRQSLTTAVNNIISSLENSGVTDTSVQVVAINSTTNSSGNISLDLSGPRGGTGGDNSVFALIMGGAPVGSTVQVTGLANAVLMGPGSLEVMGGSAARIEGDMAAQMVTGGSGNDTMVGGGGNDTLIGGGGNDTFGFNAIGHYSIGGFGTGDQLAFPIPGITSLEELALFVTGFNEVDGNTVIAFGNAISITMVGIPPNQLTADMIAFTI